MTISLQKVNSHSSEISLDTACTAQSVVDDIVESLSPLQLQQAADTSYQQTKDTYYHAKQMVERYYESCHHDADKTLRRVQATLAFRQERKLHQLRQATLSPNSRLYQSLQPGHLHVAGYDHEGRSTLHFTPRKVQQHDDYTLCEHLYTLERAIACSKHLAQVNAVVDFDGFSTHRGIPPRALGAELFACLRHHYAGHVHAIYLLNVPTAFYCLWSIFKPLAGRSTRRKIQFVNKVPHYEESQATKAMGGSMRPLQVNEYLQETPFHKAFGEK